MKKRNAMIARSGIQYYLDDELPGLNLMNVPREYKGQRVFSVYRPSFVLEAAKDEFKGKPIRVDHKWVDNLADPEIIGYIDSDVSIKHNKDEVALCAHLDMKDDAAMPSYKELSPGYISVNEWRPGTSPSGEPYEILCTKIKSVNHLAVVREARGGKDMKILDGGKRLMIHSGLIRAVKRKLMGVLDGKPQLTFEEIVDEIGANIKNMDEEDMSAKTASLIGACKDLPDSDEKEKLTRYIADIPLLKDEDKAVADEALSCIKESYKSLDSDAMSETTEKQMEEEKKEAVEEKVEAPAADADVQVSAEEPKKEEAPAVEEKAKDEEKDVNAKILDALDAISKRLEALEGKGEEVKDEAKEEVKEEVKDEAKEEVKEECVSDSLPRYTQTLSSIEAGYSLDDAFAKLKGRR